MTQTSPTRLQAVLRKCLLVFATGLILSLVSEALFYGLVRHTDSLFGYAVTGVLYGYAAWLFLIVVTCFNIKSKAALFLAGGFFGWMVEGVFVSTMYGIPDMPFPLSIPVTGLSWHALLSVMAGLYGTRVALRKSGTTVQLAVITGVFWGLWAATWRSADKFLQEVGVELFFLCLCILIVLFVAGHRLWQKMAQTPLEFGKWEIRIAVGGATLWFFLVTVPQHPMAVSVLPPLLVLMYMALKKNRVREESGNLLTELADEIPLTRYLPFALVPPIAASIYAVTETIPKFEYNLAVVMVVTGVIGTWIFIASTVRLLKS